MIRREVVRRREVALVDLLQHHFLQLSQKLSQKL